jgi:hypothetical protein
MPMSALKAAAPEPSNIVPPRRAKSKVPAILLPLSPAAPLTAYSDIVCNIGAGAPAVKLSAK